MAKWLLYLWKNIGKNVVVTKGIHMRDTVGLKNRGRALFCGFCFEKGNKQLLGVRRDTCALLGRNKRMTRQ